LQPDALVTKPSALREWGKRYRRLLSTVLAPRPTLTLTEWSDRFRRLSRETSASPGRWRTEAMPHLAGIMDAMTDPAIETVVVMAAAQIGKSEATLNLVGYTISHDPGPMLVVLPTLELARSWSTDRLAPMARDSEILRGRIREGRARDQRSTMLSIKFDGGSLTIAGSNSPASLSSRPVRTLVLDELDRFNVSTAEGDSAGLATRRTAAFPGRKIVKASTPTVKGLSQIEAAFEEGDQRRFHVPCPNCSEFQPLEWKGVKWDQGHSETAGYACQHCGAMIEERQKLAMLQAGRWVAAHPERPIASFHISALYSPFIRWGEIARDFLDSRGNPERMRVFTNCQLGETFAEASERIGAHELLGRLEPYEAVSAGAGILTAGIDTQSDRLELSVWAWGAGEESWLIEHVLIPGDPGTVSPWRELDERLRARYPHESGGTLGISCAFIDAGGHHSGDVYRFTRERIGRQIFACRGAPLFGAPVLSKPSRNNSAKAILYTVGVSTLKQTLMSGLRTQTPGPGYVHLPESCGIEYLNQLTGEQLVTRWCKGRPIREWVATRDRVEALDCYNYARAALHKLGLSVIRRLGKLAERVAKAPPEEPVEVPAKSEPSPAFQHLLAQQRRTSPRASSWVGKW
jgi:phage terminase large subunit GpA-like protein